MTPARKPEYHPGNPWANQALIDRVTVLWKEGKSATEVAQTVNHEMGLKLTRNSIISKVTRMGLTRPDYYSDVNRHKAQIAMAALGRLARKERLAAIDEDQNAVRRIVARRTKPAAHQVLKFGEPRSAKKRAGKAIKASVALENVPPVEILHLKPSHCRWPIDRDEPGAWFCGADKARGSYCEHHLARATCGMVAA